MKKIVTPFSDVWILQPKVFQDSRGFFLESYSYSKLTQLGIDTVFLQDNHSKSMKNTIRGLHFQLSPGQEKLVRCSKGEIWDVIVDIRSESPTFKQSWGINLSEDNFKQLYIPVGFAHGFSVLSDIAEVQYKVSNYYDSTIERGIKWNDSELNIDWKISDPVISNRDQENPSLNEFFKKNPAPFA